MACFERQPRGHRTLRPFPVRQSAFCKVRSAAPPPAAPGQQEQRCSARRSHLRHTRHPPAAPQRTPFATPGSSQHGCFHVQPPCSSALPVLFHQETAGAVPGFPRQLCVANPAGPSSAAANHPGSFALPILVGQSAPTNLLRCPEIGSCSHLLPQIPLAELAC